MRPIDVYFLEKEEPVRSCLLYLRTHIGGFDTDITEEWKYKMPFYYYKGKMLCYLWTNKRNGAPYIGIVDGNKMNRPELLSEKRNRMKILPIDPIAEIPVALIDSILYEAISLQKLKTSLN
jgi:hypothetical protein